MAIYVMTKRKMPKKVSMGFATNRRKAVKQMKRYQKKTGKTLHLYKITARR